MKKVTTKVFMSGAAFALVFMLVSMVFAQGATPPPPAAEPELLPLVPLVPDAKEAPKAKPAPTPAPAAAPAPAPAPAKAPAPVKAPAPAPKPAPVTLTELPGAPLVRPMATAAVTVKLNGATLPAWMMEP